MRIKRRKLEVTPPYVSMADIAFNLVLFFLILAKTQDDSHIQWEPVRAGDLKQAPSSRMSVTVDNAGKTYFNGKEISTLGLSGEIKKHLEENPGDNRTVLLKIHKDTRAKIFDKIMEGVSQEGCEIIHVLEEEP